MVVPDQFFLKGQFVLERGFFLHHIQVDDVDITVLVCAQTLRQVAVQANAEE